MQLTGKTKEEFEKWLFKYYYEPERKSQVTAKLNVVSFKNRDIATQIGVLILYFDSVGIEIVISFDSGWWDVHIDNEWLGTFENTREQAWTQAIEKATEIRNEQLK